MSVPPPWFLLVEQAKDQADHDGIWVPRPGELAHVIGGPVPAHRTTVWRAIQQAIDYGLLDRHSTTREIRLP